ncbi:uncharacterized protein TM35_000211510 [Trypanosoma theileri]|uniref:Uncharacterized protein n=1 Tax=Trypanosoma theileri TaxID=67003 RepID=A0A1X0NS63_9TRYP|nr:uncharacterized protein TM35_000211510 [Trypanosoma theileri]ORC87545.1 hypothetical protein TM35_000211510 [Trypanosoma theileri]
MAWFPLRLWSRSSPAVVEGHFWALTRYRIGRRFIGLDYADNVILFPAYRTRRWGGWAAVTLGANNTGYVTNDTSAVNVLEDGYPLHWRASAKLQAFVAEEKRMWQAKREAELVRRAAEKAAEKIAATAGSTNNAVGGGGKTDGSGSQDKPAGGQDGNSHSNGHHNHHPHVGGSAARTAETYLYDSEQDFRDALTIKCSSPGFVKRHLRISRLTTIIYKALYFYLWGIAISLIVQAYLMFRSWLNPPARQGLKNLEDHVLHIPKVLFAFCVSGVAWVARKLHPVVDPLLQLLEEKFPQVNWSVASPEAIATRADQLAGHDKATSPGAAAAAANKAALKKKAQMSSDEGRRGLWMQILMALLCVFSLLCVL